jgi:hypothetical protein
LYDNQGASDGMAFYVANAASSKQAESNHVRVVGTPFGTVGRFAADTVDLNVGGTNTAQQIGLGAPVFAGPLAIGCDAAGNNQTPVYIGPVIISPTRKSDAWVTAIQAGSGTTYDNLNTLWGMMASGDLLLPLDRNGYGWVKR